MATHPALAAAAAVDSIAQGARAAAASARAGRRIQEASALVAISRSLAAIASLLRDGSAQHAEVKQRMEAIEPVVRARVCAAAEGQEAKLDGGMRARRNVATHVYGLPFELIAGTDSDAKRVQRSGRRRRANLAAVAAGEEELQAARLAGGQEKTEHQNAVSTGMSDTASDTIDKV